MQHSSTAVEDDLERVWLMVDGMEEVPVAEEDGACDWCGEIPSGAGYFVAARDERYAVCPECWGRAPEYLDLRQDGWEHEAAVRRLCGI
jgi:hypothetical protein